MVPIALWCGRMVSHGATWKTGGSWQKYTMSACAARRESGHVCAEGKQVDARGGGEVERGVGGWGR